MIDTLILGFTILRESNLWGILGRGVFLSKVDVYLNDNQIENLKMILNQSKAGHHLLFDHELISQVYKEDFDEDEFFTVENLVKAQEDLIKLIQMPNTAQKKTFLSSLDPHRLTRIVRAYFYIIENEIKLDQSRLH